MNEEIVALLNQDLEGEHAAIIQYLKHAYAMGEGEMACEIEAIAREEMRHFDWLAETIVSLGGTPSLTRGEMRLGGATVSDWMRNDVQQEQDGIALYKQHIETIKDPKIKRLLQRILSDEESHLGDFNHFVEKAQREGMQDKSGSRQDRLSQMLNWGIEHEYTVVLQYLIHSYMTPHTEVRDELQDQAINEMQHLGWLAEEMVDQGSKPRMEHTEVDRSKNTKDMLKADITVERQVEQEYTRQIAEVAEPDLKELITRIRDHENYHVRVFTELLEELKG